MDIGAIGWWNYDNAGDLAMLGALRQGLSPHRIVPIDIGFAATPDAIHRLNRLDYVLLGGGTLISGRPDAPFDTFDRWAAQLECPVGVVGLGVDPFMNEYRSPIEALLDQAEFFYVRDRASHALLGGHPKVQIAPDLTFADPLPAGPSVDHVADAIPVCGVNLRRSVGLDAVPWLRTIASLPVRIKGVALSSFAVFDEATLLRQLDPACCEPFEIAVYSQLDLMIASAFHSVLFAVQAGIPVIAIDYAPKVRNFMEDVGLARYLLGPDDYTRLPALVTGVLADRSSIRNQLRAIRTRLHEDARRAIVLVREQIEEGGLHRRRSGARIAVAVVASGDAMKDHRTLASVMSQTYEDVDVVQVSTGPEESAGARLVQALTQSCGEYLTWVESGDWLADDALDCLVSCLQRDPQQDLVYADFYAMNESNLPVGHYVVRGPEKLFRRDVVGPCFLMHRALLDNAGGIAADAPLVGYDLWLRAHPNSTFVPFHAPVFYSQKAIQSRQSVERERATRRQRRRAQSIWVRAIWAVLDSDLGERFLIRPLVYIMKVIGIGKHAKHA